MFSNHVIFVWDFDLELHYQYQLSPCFNRLGKENISSLIIFLIYYFNENVEIDFTVKLGAIISNAQFSCFLNKRFVTCLSLKFYLFLVNNILNVTDAMVCYIAGCCVQFSINCSQHVCQPRQNLQLCQAKGGYKGIDQSSKSVHFPFYC